MSYGLLSPRVDFVFKKIFGNEQHPNILISFLNAVLNQKDVITSVKILNTDIDKEHIEDKYSRLDIKATTNNKEHINIEIQVKNEYNMVKRSMYYWSKMYESQIIEGDDYDKLARKRETKFTSITPGGTEFQNLTKFQGREICLF
ncbi:MAG: Rpn family recombination-promoting nuclease/putative transposase [Paraclostridium sp.]